MRNFAVVLLASVGLLACGNGGGATGTGGSSSSSSTGTGGSEPPPGKPIVWEALPSAGAPSARFDHTAVWTGAKMVVWGGLAGAVTDSGGAYDPQAKSWSATSTTGAPAPRYGHTAVWTGTKMIVWGGYGQSALAPAGGVYDPATDTWKAMSTTGQPSPRQGHTAVWTGSKMIIWGGRAGGSTLASGGVYDPAADAWTPVATQSAPAARYDQAAVWTGSHMLVWAGYDTFDWRNDGATFDPASGAGGTWLGAMSTTGAPSKREGAAAVWTSSQLLVWGGWTGGPYEDTGGLFTPGASAGGTWSAITHSSAPSPRGEQVGVWSGSDLVVWGGCGGDMCGDVLGDGGRYEPGGAGGRWTPIAEQSALEARRGHAGVVTGTSIIVWGGRKDATHALDSGAEAPL